ncbi:hypothetical protein M407DRAFT_21738 [Tulasnella calospora MUT 4182]|uniref:Transmembrane protein n=1 Tax=Tulasnella calospora MUT 4182 TaxID=1051891 RepID=A0A0C3QDQ2_9AGAM|nr:hypothetical protein M407DRAFT_21738 [Tulasnella calospora MUT 4182]
MSAGNPNDRIPPVDYLTPTPASRVAHATPSNSSSVPTVPSLLRTPPSTLNLAELAAVSEGSSRNNNSTRLSPPLESQTPGAGPSRSPLGSAGSRSPSTFSSSLSGSHARPGDGQQQPPFQPTSSRQPGTVPFPSKSSSSSSSHPAMVQGGSNLSEQPDTVPSLIQTIPGPNVGRGRRTSRPSITGGSRRRWSDPDDPARALGLTPSSSREPQTGTPKRVSFDNESLQHSNAPGTNGAPLGDTTTDRREASAGGLKRISSSLERIKQAFTSRPASDPILPEHHDPPSRSPPTRSQSPYRVWQLRRNPHFWPTPTPRFGNGNTRAWSRPCDPYEFPDGQASRPERLWLKHGGNSGSWACCGSSSLYSALSNLPFFQATLFWIEYVARQMYRHCFLRLPSLYFRRVWRIIFEAQVTRAELDQIIQQRQLGVDFPIQVQWIPPVVSPGLARFRNEWEDFIDNLLKEWKTFNVVSALLLSAILTIFQLDGSTQPITRTAALASLGSGLWSLIYGGVYVVRFQSMKNMIKATRWAEAAQDTVQAIFWNVWVFLALPAVSLAYSIIFFFISVMSFVWTTGTDAAPSPIPENLAFIPRTLVTCVFALGFVYFIFVIRTFKSYSDPWPNQIVDMAEAVLTPRGRDFSSRDPFPAPNDDRGRTSELQREARERRTSLRRFGSPDIYYRQPYPPTTGTHSAPVLPTQGMLGFDPSPTSPPLPVTTPLGAPGGIVSASDRRNIFVGGSTMPIAGGTHFSSSPPHDMIPMPNIGASERPPSYGYPPEKTTGQAFQEQGDAFGRRRRSPLKMDAMPLPEEKSESTDDDESYIGII